jgi:hypothetical protein
MTRKDQPFSWGVEVLNAFQFFEGTTTPLMIHVNPSKPIVLKIDTSDFIISDILSQLGEDNLLHLVSFHFRKSFHAKINYVRFMIKNF